jgi:hypothetical protein
VAAGVVVAGGKLGAHASGKAHIFLHTTEAFIMNSEHEENIDD